MKEKYKKDSLEFWNNHSTLWEHMVYDKEKKFLRFPTSGQREAITQREIEQRSSKDADILDLGCATGELVRSLLKSGFASAIGLDNAEEMIRVARASLQQEVSTADPERSFILDDVDNLKATSSFDVVTALGLIEYVLDIDLFFDNLRDLLRPGGYAIIESRNKLFNLHSGNRYTVDSDLEKLIMETGAVSELSPINDPREVSKTIAKSFIDIGKHLESAELGVEDETYKQVKDTFPFPLPQFSPMEFKEMAAKSGLRLKNIIYYHPHPFMPAYEKQFPEIFNRIAMHMAPLGYTPLGSSLCSSFVAIIEKE